MSIELATPALKYAQAGTAVFPCHSVDATGSCSCGKPDCAGPGSSAGKHPRTANGLKDACTDAETVKSWWTQWPDANIGIPTGSVNGFVVIDIDGPNGEASLSTLPELPPTRESKTGREDGGRHLWFAYTGSDIKNSAGKLGKGIDVRGEGGYVIAAPSGHRSGKRYAWSNSLGFAPLPEWVREKLNAPPEQPAAPRPQSAPSFATYEDVKDAAQRYAGKADAAEIGSRNTTALRLAGHVAAFQTAAGEKLAEVDVVEIVAGWNAFNSPPLPEHEIQTVVRSAMKNGTPRPPKIVTPWQPDNNHQANRQETAEPELPPIEILTAADLINASPNLREVVIDGTLRRGEIGNVIAAPKVGKTFAVLALAMAVKTADSWFGRKCNAGRVLIIDNELHKNTLARRLKMVAEAAGLTLDDLTIGIDVISLRGKLRDLRQMGAIFATITPGHYALIIIDSLYRAMPAGMDENSNVDVTQLYNLLDQYAALIDSAIVVVHHTSKGTQAEKSVTDVGAGAGAQARAADAHIVLRPHEEDDVVVVDAVVRSFPPSPASCWRINVPTFTPEPDLDPTQLRISRRRKSDSESTEKSEPWTPARFAETFLTPESQIIEQIESAAKGYDLSQRELHRLLRQATAQGLATKTGGVKNNPARYAAKPHPTTHKGEKNGS
jgi:hypothetical protein